MYAYISLVLDVHTLTFYPAVMGLMTLTLFPAILEHDDLVFCIELL